jgi:HEPN domain-containing protein
MTAFIEEASRLVRLAERDFRAFMVLGAHPDVDLAITCFHAQQAVEKALKAALTVSRLTFPRTHNLEELASLIADAGGSLPLPPREFRLLNPFAVQFRYDDQAIALLTRDEAQRIASLTLAWATAVVAQAPR